MSIVSVTYALTGSWTNLLFYGFELVLSGFYFHRSKPSGFFLWTLAASLFIDTVFTGLLCYSLYFELVVSGGVVAGQPYWTLSAMILCNYHAAMLEQIFFTHRYWQITHNKVVTGMILTLVTAHMVFAWALGIYLYLVPGITPLSENFTIVAATLCAATDTFIALVTFHTMRTITGRTTYSATQSLLHRISVQCVVCGFTTAIWTIIVLLLLVTGNPNPFALVFDVLGRIYTLTILVNYMVVRKAVTRASTNGDDSSSVRTPRTSLTSASNMPQTFTVPTELSTIHHERPPF
jgi:hypothetical protein